jgi:hypothetical protein
MKASLMAMMILLAACKPSQLTEIQSQTTAVLQESLSQTPTSVLELTDNFSEPGVQPSSTPPLPSNTSQAPQSQASPEAKQPNCVSDPNPQFTAHFTDLSKIEFISPIGVVTHSIIPHSYVWIGIDLEGQVYEVPVYAPVDSILSGAAFSQGRMQDENGQWVDVAQYSLHFEVSCEVSYHFAHIDRVADWIAAVVPTVPSESSRTIEVRPPLSVKAGDLIAYTSGTISAHNWDFGVYNRSKSNQFINQERYENVDILGNSLYADCPYKYFGDDLRDQLYALLPGADCGSASRDIVGTVEGSWFAEADFDLTSSGAALAIGGTVTPGGEFVVVRSHEVEVRVFPGQSTYLCPERVTSEHCYQDQRDEARFAYLRLLSDMELAVVFGDGACPQEMPDGSHNYYR